MILSVFLLSCPPTVLLCALLQGAAVIKRFSSFENTIPSCRKDEAPNCMVNAVSKQGFAIYVDDPEDKENYSCQVSEDLELGHCELNTSAMTSSIHLLLDLSSGNSCYYSDVSSTAIAQPPHVGWLRVMNCKLVSSVSYNK